MRALAAEAGFGRTRVRDADGGFFRLYELRDESGAATTARGDGSWGS